MMKITSIIGIMLIAGMGACNRPSPHNNWIGNSNRIEVYRSKADGTKKLIFETVEKEQINKFRYFLDFEDTPVYKCGFEGMIRAYQGEEVLDMAYNLRNDCQHFSYMYEGTLYAKKISQEGVIFLYMIGDGE